MSTTPQRAPRKSPRTQQLPRTPIEGPLTSKSIKSDSVTTEELLAANSKV